MASTQDQTPSAQENPATEGADQPASSSGDSGGKAAKRPRRATKKTSAPATSEQASDSGAAAGNDGSPSAAAGDDTAGERTAAPARKTAKRAARKKAPAAEQPTDAATDTVAAADADRSDGAADAAGEAPAAKKTGTKAAKKTAKKTTRKRAVADEGAAASQPGEGDTSDAPAAERKAGSRASRSRTERGDAQAEGREAQAADVPVDEDQDADQDPESAATVPSFGVLFQAPEPPAAPTRKRAAKKAASKAPAADEQDEQAQPDDAATAAPEAGEGTSEDAEAGEGGGRRRRRRGGKGRGKGRGGQGDEAQDETTSDTEQGDAEGDQEAAEAGTEDAGEGSSTSRRRRRRRRSGSAGEGDDPPGTVTKLRESRRDEPQSVKGSTRLEAKKQRRREGREAGRRRTVITEAEFLARRESVERVMVVRERDGKTQIGVLEDGVLVEHYVSRETNASMAGNVYLGRVQNVLPSMEAAFVDIGKGRNAVLYAGEVNWDAAGLENNQPKRIENALKSGDSVLVQVTKDPIGHKGARLTSQISLPGRYLVYVPEGSMTGISRKLPDTERARLKAILKEVVPDSAGVIVRTAAEGASEEELRADVERLTKTWEKIQQKAQSKGKAKGGVPALVHGEPDLTVRVIRDVFNEDFSKLVVAGEQAWSEVSEYLGDVAPDLAKRLEKWTGGEDLFTRYRVDEQIAKAMDRKVWLPSGGSLVIDRTEAMTVVDVNTGKFVGSGGNLEETVTKNNIEAAEEIVRQLRLRDIGGIIVIDFIDMVLESNRDLVVRRLLECLGRDRTKHQVAEVTSLGLVQMTRKRVGSGLIEVFSETCEHCGGRGIIVHDHPVEKSSGGDSGGGSGSGGNRGGRGGRRTRSGSNAPAETAQPVHHGGPTPAQIAAAAHAAALKSAEHHDDDLAGEDLLVDAGAPTDQAPEGESADETAFDQVPGTHQDSAGRQDTREDAEPAPMSAAAESSAVEPQHAAQTQPAAQPAAAPKRRKRGRVMAPAGPPRAAAVSSGDTPAEAASDGS